MNNKQNCNTTACMQNLQSVCFHITINTRALPEVRTFSVQHTLVNQYEFMSSSKFNLFWQQQEQTICLPPQPYPKRVSQEPPPYSQWTTLGSLKNLDDSKISKLPNATLHPFPPPPPKRNTYSQVSNFFFPLYILAKIMGKQWWNGPT